MARVRYPNAYVTPAPPTPKLTPPLFVLLASKCSHGVGVGTSKSVAAARINNIIRSAKKVNKTPRMDVAKELLYFRESGDLGYTLKINAIATIRRSISLPNSRPCHPVWCSS